MNSDPPTPAVTIAPNPESFMQWLADSKSGGAPKELTPTQRDLAAARARIAALEAERDELRSALASLPCTDPDVVPDARYICRLGRGGRFGFGNAITPDGYCAQHAALEEKL